MIVNPIGYYCSHWLLLSSAITLGFHDSKTHRLLLFPLVITIHCYNQWDYMIVNPVGYYCSHWLLLSIAITNGIT